MQEHEQPTQKKPTPWILIILVILAVGILVFLVCRIFQKRDTLKQIEEQKTSLEQQRRVADNFKSFNPRLTTADRKQKVHTFFGKNK